MMAEGLNVGKRSGTMSAFLKWGLNSSDAQCSIVAGQTLPAGGLGIGEQAQERKRECGCEKKHHDGTMQTLSLRQTSSYTVVPASMLYGAYSGVGKKTLSHMALSVLFNPELKGRARPF